MSYSCSMGVEGTIALNGLRELRDGLIRNRLQRVTCGAPPGRHGRVRVLR